MQGSEIDYLSLAEVLLRDKNYSRAKSALMKAKKNRDDIEEEHYHLLNGLYLLRTKKAEDSIPELLKVRDRDYLDKKQIYLAEAYLEINQKTDALRQINKVKMGEKTSDAVKHLKAKILFETKIPKSTGTSIRFTSLEKGSHSEANTVLPDKPRTL